MARPLSPCWRSPLYTRLVSPSEYGIYSLSFTAATLLYSAFLFWLRDALIRFMPVYTEREQLRDIAGRGRLSRRRPVYRC